MNTNKKRETLPRHLTQIMRSVGLIARMLLLITLAAPLAVATPGIFEGVVYEADEPKVPHGWILVQAKNGMLRKVEISRARVVYARSVPSKDRVPEPSVALVHGTEIRVIAEQDSSGEWRATQIEILRVSKKKEGSRSATQTAVFSTPHSELPQVTGARWTCCVTEPPPSRATVVPRGQLVRQWRVLDSY